MIRRASTQKMPQHMIRQRKEPISLKGKIRQAQSHSVSQREVKITLKPAPWEPDSIRMTETGEGE